MKKNSLLVFLLSVVCINLALANNTSLDKPSTVSNYLIYSGDTWLYDDSGSDLGTTWKDLSYADATWQQGNAVLGYGDGAETTTLNYGTDSSNKTTTYYFRKHVNIVDASLISNLNFQTQKDDGVIVYVNGQEAFRLNMPSGTVAYNTYASSTVAGSDETTWNANQVTNLLQDGDNVIAVELHQATAGSSDLRFDMSLEVDYSTFDCTTAHIGCFTSIEPTAQTSNLIISDDHRFQLIFKQGDAYLDGSGTVPGNNDFTGYVPIAGSSTNGYLAVNHENTPGGVSIVDLNFNSSTSLWTLTNSQPVDLYNTFLETTTRNCSGGITPWGTVVTAEESSNTGDNNNDGYEDVGWLVEIDPVTAQVMDYGNGQEKLWAMGRMQHENVVITDDSTTAYYGEDGGTDCMYKYVMDTPGDLTSGTVYVLVLDSPLSGNDPTSTTGQWVQVPNTTQADRNNMAANAAALGGTNFNGVEDAEINPLTGQIYFAAKGKSRTYRFTEDGTGVKDFETFVGGTSYDITTANGVFNEAWGSGNDNLTFDDKGNLWVLQDGGNNYIWVVRPDHTQANPHVDLFASMPIGSEPTGLTFSPDYKFGFFSVQHPNGSNTAQLDATFNNVTFDQSSTIVFALNENLGVQAPVTDFSADVVQVEKGQSVTFSDLSINNPDTWNWTFTGGTPSTSNVPNPVVTYDTEGVFAVTLETSNVAGTNELEKVDYIEVTTLSVDETLKNNISLYPNPTQGNLYISIKEGNEVSVEVYDLLGRRVQNIQNLTVSNQPINLDLSTSIQNNQVLIVKVTVDGKTGSYKVLTTK